MLLLSQLLKLLLLLLLLLSEPLLDAAYATGLYHIGKLCRGGVIEWGRGCGVGWNGMEWGVVDPTPPHSSTR